MWGTSGGEYGGDYGNDTIAGDALTVAANTTALANNDAIVNAYGGSASAGDDRIFAADGNHVIGGDAVALGDGGVAPADNTAWGAGSSAGNDYIEIRHSGEEHGGDDGCQIYGAAIAPGDEGNVNDTKLGEFVDENAGGENQ